MSYFLGFLLEIIIETFIVLAFIRLIFTFLLNRSIIKL